MRKGVSAVIAVILILMITVALAAMAYVWFTSVFQSLTEGAGGAAEQTATALGTSFTIDSAAYTSGSNVVVSIRNTGSQSIDLNGMAFFIFDLPATIATVGNSSSGTTLQPGEFTSDTPFTIQNTSTIGPVCPGPATLKATVSAGFAQSTTITC